MFIRVTSLYSKKPIYVNIDHISSVEVHVAADDTIDGSILYLLGGKRAVYAEENIEDIYRQIEGIRRSGIREINT